MPERTSPPFFFHQRRPGKLNGMGASRHLSREAIDEFKAIYQGEFDQNLSDDEAQEIGLRLLRLFDILLQPFPTNSSNQTVAR